MKGSKKLINKILNALYTLKLSSSLLPNSSEIQLINCIKPEEARFTKTITPLKKKKKDRTKMTVKINKIK